jgi:hypothetical protein
LAAIDTEVAFRGIQTLYRIKNLRRSEDQRLLAVRARWREASDNRRVQRFRRLTLSSLEMEKTPPKREKNF